MSREELAEQADVDVAFIERLIEIGALGEGGADAFGSMDVRRTRLLRAWENAGLRADGIMDLVRKGELSVGWLTTPVMTRARRLETTLRDFCQEMDVPQRLVEAVYEAIGFAPPSPSDGVREGDRELVELVTAFVGVGAEEGRHSVSSASTRTASVASRRPRLSSTRRRSKSVCDEPDRASGSCSSSELDSEIR